MLEPMTTRANLTGRNTTLANYNSTNQTSATSSPSTNIECAGNATGRFTTSLLMSVRQTSMIGPIDFFPFVNRARELRRDPVAALDIIWNVGANSVGNNAIAKGPVAKQAMMPCAVLNGDADVHTGRRILMSAGKDILLQRSHYFMLW